MEFFAELLHVPRSSITIATGQAGRNKVVRITRISAERLRESLEHLF